MITVNEIKKYKKYYKNTKAINFSNLFAKIKTQDFSNLQEKLVVIEKYKKDFDSLDFHKQQELIFFIMNTLEKEVIS